MKNKKFWRTFAALCTSLVLMGGFSVTAFAQGSPETASASMPRVIDSLSELDTPPDLLILPLPLTRTGDTLSTPLEKERPPVYLGVLLTCCRPDTRIYGGMTPAAEEFAQLCQRHGLSFTDYLSDEAFALKNADATAEAAVALAIDLLPRNPYTGYRRRQNCPQPDTYSLCNGRTGVCCCTFRVPEM